MTDIHWTILEWAVKSLIVALAASVTLDRGIEKWFDRKEKMISKIDDHERQGEYLSQ